MNGRMPKQLRDEIASIVGITDEEFAIALAEKYNLETITVRREGLGQLGGVVAAIGLINRHLGTRLLLFRKEQVQNIDVTGLCLSGKPKKLAALESDLNKMENAIPIYSL